MVDVQKRSVQKTLKELIENNLFTLEDKKRIGPQTRRALKFALNDLSALDGETPEYQDVSDYFPEIRDTSLEEDIKLTDAQIEQDKQLASRIVKQLYVMQLQDVIQSYFKKEQLEKLKLFELDYKEKKANSEREQLLRDVINYQEMEAMRQRILQELIQAQQQIQSLNEYIAALFQENVKNKAARDSVFQKHTDKLVSKMSQLTGKDGKMIFEGVSEDKQRQFARAYVESNHVMQRNLEAQVEKSHPDIHKKLVQSRYKINQLKQERGQIIAQMPPSPDGWMPGKTATKARDNKDVQRIDEQLKVEQAKVDHILSYFTQAGEHQIVKQLAEQFEIDALKDPDNAEIFINAAQPDVKAAHEEANVFTDKIESTNEKVVEAKQEVQTVRTKSIEEIIDNTKGTELYDVVENVIGQGETIYAHKEVVEQQERAEQHQSDALDMAGLAEMDIEQGLDFSLEPDDIFADLDDLDVSEIEQKLLELDQESQSPEPAEVSTSPKP